MAIQTRYAGDVLPVNNVDNAGTTATIISTGLTKNPVALKVSATNLGAAGEMATGGAVETILRAIAQDSTVVMYQVDTGMISVLVEASGAGAANSGYGAQTVSSTTIATAMQTRLQALLGAASTLPGPTGTTTGGNIGLAGNVWANNITVTGANGFKLA